MRRSAFTLVEMLVVIGIIVVLVALLVPVAAIAVSRARNFSMSSDIGQLASAIDTYKKEKGDYPPSMGEIDNAGTSLYLPATRYTTVCERHLRKCYPKMTNAEKDFFYDNIAPRLTGDEALVFWLSQTQNDERNPFTSRANNFKKYYDFKQERLVDFDSDQFNGNFPDGQPGQLNFVSYKPTYAGETPYVYLDARTYAMHRQAQYAISGMVQGYFNDTITSLASQQSYMGASTFQIICAGQDREFGQAFDQFDNSNNVQQPKRFKSGENYTDEDRDNLTNFSEGRRLEDHIP
jgi:prepilin-type N-terminal cleavage/methylation domain-containing protein